jgi:hypothetical protein
MLSYGLVFVPFLAFFNYLAQKRSIAKQEAAFPMRQASTR